MYAPGFGPIVPQECGDCGKKFSMGGPIWSAPIHDHDWVPSIMSNISAMKDRYPAYERISALLTSVSEVSALPFSFIFINRYLNCCDHSKHETIMLKYMTTREPCSYILYSTYHMQELLDVPLFVNAHSLCSTLKCTSPTMAMFRSALINAGYRVSGSHVDPLALKTDAPMNIIWDIMRCWVPVFSSIVEFSLKF